MATMGKMIIIVGLAVLLSGCTIHIKAEKLELEGERQRVQFEQTYRLKLAGLFDVKNSQ